MSYSGERQKAIETIGCHTSFRRCREPTGRGNVDQSDMQPSLSLGVGPTFPRRPVAARFSVGPSNCPRCWRAGPRTARLAVTPRRLPARPCVSWQSRARTSLRRDAARRPCAPHVLHEANLCSTPPRRAATSRPYRRPRAGVPHVVQAVVSIVALILLVPPWSTGQGVPSRALGGFAFASNTGQASGGLTR